MHALSPARQAVVKHAVRTLLESLQDLLVVETFLESLSPQSTQRSASCATWDKTVDGQGSGLGGSGREPEWSSNSSCRSSAGSLCERTCLPATTLSVTQQIFCKPCCKKRQPEQQGGATHAPALPAEVSFSSAAASAKASAQAYNVGWEQTHAQANTCRQELYSTAYAQGTQAGRGAYRIRQGLVAQAQPQRRS